MKLLHHTTDQELRPSLQQIGKWPLALSQLHQRLAPYFARPEPYHHALLYLQAILSEIPRKNGFPKRGKHSAGVGHQYCGCTGRVENCQVGVFLSYVTATGHTLIDRALYLPEDWCDDPVRRQAAHIPEHLTFQTKPELALQMVHRAQSAGLPIRWVVADTVYGHSTDLRVFLEAQGFPFALAVPANEVVCVQTSQGYRLCDAASIEQQVLGKEDWQRLSMSQGTKGERLFDWAILPQVLHGTVDSCHWLVIRRCLDAPFETVGAKVTYVI